MTIETIIENIKRDKYKAVYQPVPAKLPKNHIEDENQTVVWNRNFVAQQHDEIKELHLQNRKAQNAADAAFEIDMLQALQDEYHLTQHQAAVVYRNAWEDGHSGGLMEVLNSAQELCEFWNEMNKEA